MSLEHANMRAVSSRGAILGEEAIESIVDSVVLYFKLYAETLGSDAYRDFIKIFNAYLEEVSPISYIPGLAREISEAISISLWDTKIDPEFLRRLLLDIYRVVKSREGISDLRRDLRGLVNAIEGERSLLELVEKIENPEHLASIAVLVLIISTNP
ncbi:MAG: hypothetical protein ACO2OR_04060 [Desulfurococcaceae archaeon]